MRGRICTPIIDAGGSRSAQRTTKGGGQAAENLQECVHTTMRSPSQSAVLNDWSFAGGLPGSTARIEAGGSVEGRSLRLEPRYTIARLKSEVPGNNIRNGIEGEGEGSVNVQDSGDLQELVTVMVMRRGVGSCDPRYGVSLPAVETSTSWSSSPFNP